MSQTATPSLARATALALLLIMGAMWGLQFAMLKMAARGGYSDLAVLAMALILLSLIFAGIAAARGVPFWPDRRMAGFYLITSVLGYILPLFAVLYASATLGAGMLTLIASMSPVVAISVALALKTERVSPGRIAALVLGLVSVSLILIPQVDLGDLGAARWIAIGFVVPLCYGIEAIYISRRWPAGKTAIEVVTGQTIVATLLVVPVVLILEGMPTQPPELGRAELAVVIFVLAGVIESLIYFVLIRRTGGVYVNFASFISLFAGIGWGALLFAETLSVMAWSAVLALVASLVLVTRN